MRKVLSTILILIWLPLTGFAQQKSAEIEFVEASFLSYEEQMPTIDTSNFDDPKNDCYALSFSAKGKIRKFQKVIAKIEKMEQLKPMNIRSVQAGISLHYTNDSIVNIWVFGDYFVAVNENIYRGGQLLYTLFFKNESSQIRCRYAQDYSRKVFKNCRKLWYQFDKKLADEVFESTFDVVFSARLLDFVPGSCGFLSSPGQGIFEIMDKDAASHLGDTVFVNIMCASKDFFIVDAEYAIEASYNKPDDFPILIVENFEKYNYTTVFANRCVLVKN